MINNSLQQLSNPSWLLNVSKQVKNIKEVYLTK